MLEHHARAKTKPTDAGEPVPFVDLVAQYQDIKAEIDAAVARVFARGHYVLGAEVESFEREFAAFTGTEHAIGVSNGLDALRLALMALGVGPGDEVVVPANTFIATALAASSLGARPVLVDCDPRTYNIDVSRIESVLTPRTRAIIPVHLTGQAADLGPLLTLAATRGIPVIEDAAQAHGTRYRGRPCGSLGAIGCFSFYPAKNLGAAGDGGAVVTSDPSLARSLRQLRSYGEREKYEHEQLGLNARLDSLQAAVLCVKLEHLPRWNAARVRHAERYRSALDGVGDLVFQGRSADSTHNYHLFTIETARRDALRLHLDAAGVRTGVHYPIPIHLQPAYAGLGLGRGTFPHTERLAGRILSLPMYPELTDAQIERVADAIRSFFQGPHS